MRFSTSAVKLSSLALLAGTAMTSVAQAEQAPQREPAATDRAASAIIVTGRRIVETPTAAAAVQFGTSVQLVTAETIEASGASNFAEIAQFLIKGANVGYSPDEGEYTIRLDGGGDRDTLVVLDNVPLYDRGPTLETIWPATTLDPHMVERVEVFRGGNSLFFGSNGGIGVVNVVTKRPDGTNKVEFGASYGSFNSRELWGNARFKLTEDGSHSFMVYGGSQQTDGPRIYNPADYVDNVAAGGGVQKFPLNRTNVGFKYLWQIDDKSDLRVNGQYTEIIFQDAFPDTNTFSPNRVRYPIVDLSLDRKWSDQLYTEFGFYWTNPLLNNTETFPDVCLIRTGCPNPANASQIIPWGRWTGRNLPFVNQGFGPDSKVGGFQEFGYNLRNTLTLKGIGELVGGIQIVKYEDDSDRVFRLTGAQTTVTGLYIDLRPTIPFAPATNISFAVRKDFISNRGFQRKRTQPNPDELIPTSGSTSRTIWKFGLRQPIGKAFYFRANGGTSYSAPLNSELYADSLTSKGNPDLRTETTETYNGAFGVSTNFGDIALSAEAGAFKTYVSDRIQATAGLTPNTFFNNSQKTIINGITADVNLNIGKTFSMGLGFTKQEAKLRGSPFQINETPEYILQGNLSYRSPDERFQLTLLPRYQGPEWSTGGPTRTVAAPGANDTFLLDGVATPIPAGIPTPRFRKNFGNYLVVNGSITYRLGEKRQHRFQLRLVNIFNERYAERYGFGNKRFSEAFVTGQIALNSDNYFYGYPFEGKPRGVYLSYQTTF